MMASAWLWKAVAVAQLLFYNVAAMSSGTGGTYVENPGTDKPNWFGNQMALQDCTTSNRKSDNWECCLLAQSYNNISAWQDTTLMVGLRAKSAAGHHHPGQRHQAAPLPPAHHRHNPRHQHYHR